MSEPASTPWRRRLKAAAFYVVLALLVLQALDPAERDSTRIVSAIFAVALGAWWWRKP